jgi:hypothetical protein
MRGALAPRLDRTCCQLLSIHAAHKGDTSGRASLASPGVLCEQPLQRCIQQGRGLLRAGRRA